MRIYTVEKTGRTGEIELTEEGYLAGLSRDRASTQKPTHEDETIMHWSVDTKLEGSTADELCEKARDYIVREWRGMIIEETTPPAGPQ